MSHLVIDFIYPFFAFIMGASVGSFLNVVIYRIPLIVFSEEGSACNQRNINLWWPPSHCPHCQNRVLKRDNIPILSWLFLKGKCRFCHAPISKQYPISEALIGIWLTLLTVIYFPEYGLIHIVAFFFLACVMYSLAIIDLKNYLLPDCLVFSLIWGGLISSAFGLIPVSPKSAVMGAVVSWGILYCTMSIYELFRGHPGLGYGDVKLFSAASIWLGIEWLPELLMISALSGGLLYIFMRIYTKGFTQHTLTEQEPQLNSNMPYIPFGPAIAVTAVFIFHVGVMA